MPTRRFTVDEAKAEILRQLRAGATVRTAMEVVGKSDKTYEYYMRTDAEFNSAVARIRALHKGADRPTVPNFPRFSEKYFGAKLYRHHLQWVDLLEDREPRELHPSQRYEPRDPDRIIINTPPFHAKSMVLTVNYTTWRIVEDPNVRVLIISKTGTSANKFLSAIKDRLSSQTRMYQELKDDFAPPSGWDGEGAVWRQNMIYVSNRDSGEKDPTVQALGIGQHIYGARADLIILDDCVDLENAHEFDKQIEWIQNIVNSRLEPGGKLLLVGTRLAAQDLYVEILKPTNYTDGDVPWTYLSQPAVLEMYPDPKDWVTLWPATNVRPPGKKVPPQNPDGTWPMWDGPRLSTVRKSVRAENWSRVYMQEQVSGSMTFTPKMVEGCTDDRRSPGPLLAGGPRPDGMAGLFVVAGLDPAPTNYTAAVVIGVDRATGRRYVLDVWNQYGAQPSQVRELIKYWTARYNVLEWRIEDNGLNKYIAQDEDILRWCRSRGVGVFPHTTTSNKWDPQFGVASMANLFLGFEHDSNMIHLPTRRNHPGMQALYEQLVAWYPTPSQTRMPVQDTVMALWFAELRARQLADEFDDNSHLESELMSPHDRENQVVVDLDDLLARSHSGGEFVMLDEWLTQNKQELDMKGWGRYGAW